MYAVAVFPDKRRMITGSSNTLRLWDLETGVVLKMMEGHNSAVHALAISRDGQIIASGDDDGKVIAWHGETGESITQPMKIHPEPISSLDFSPDGMVLATASNSSDRAVKFWCTKTWQMQGDPMECGYNIVGIRYSPSSELLAIATHSSIQIYNPGTRECVASLTGRRLTRHESDTQTRNTSLAWTPDGTRLLSGAGNYILEWDTSTWQQVGHRWEGHTNTITAIAIHPTGTLVASASNDKHVRLWRLSDQRTVAVFHHSLTLRVNCVTFSVDGKHILSGVSILDSHNPIRASFVQILAITTARDECLTGDLSIAEELLTQEILTNANDFTSYASRSFIMARKHNLDNALEDASKSINIEPSLIGFISKGIALCGKGHVREARVAFDVASMFTNQDSEINLFLLLIKAIALFNADQHEEAMLLIKDLAAVCSNVDPLVCRVVETYLRVQLGIKASDDARHDEATEHFTAAVNSTAFSPQYIHLIYADFVMLFGWDLESLLLTTHQKRCQAFLSAGKLDEALEAHKYMMDAIDDIAKGSCLNWSNGKSSEKCSTLAAHNDRILGAEIPGQEQDGYDAEPSFFYEMHQISRPRLQQRPERLKRLRLAMTRRPQEAPTLGPAPPATSPVATTSPPVATTSPPVATTSPPVAAATTTTTFKTHLRHLFTLPLHHATQPVVDVPFAQGRQRNAAAGAPGSEHSLIRDEDLPSQDPNTQHQHQPAAVQVDTGEHGGGLSCCCC
ncbi:WD40-repeat-containing domain protein [Suillus fuscotomentosus]|uniref:WD40-repeat-containing domain protein n=1 Tax=Suillus fuscotomentosus TaxID=1912939 RepID=A0AAD4DYZ7_9AGAM|nr:WD40-repeat-containing domain protein [Suillus fuscotomentosus]KAG1896237.1 WD40-repeat-containing domain protein [Suillus fuscotomentosus]